MGFNRQTRVALGFGYSGTGVGPSNLSGRVLADLITETDSDLIHLPMVTHRPLPWEPEPLRSLRVNLVQQSIFWDDAQVERTSKYPRATARFRQIFGW